MLFAARAERSADKPIKSEIKHEIMIKNEKKHHEKGRVKSVENEEKKKGGGMEKLAALIVDKRNLFFLLYIFAIVFCVVAQGWVKVENDITTYLPDDTETRQGLTVMDDNFVTTEGLAQLFADCGLPPAGAQTNESYRFYRDTAVALGYEVDDHDEY